MPQTLHIILLIFCVTIINSLINSDRKDKILSVLQKTFAERQKPLLKINTNGIYIDKYRNVLPKADDGVKSRVYSIPRSALTKDLGQHYMEDPILNFIKRRSGDQNTASDSSDKSSSLELKNWKSEWREHWVKKKFDALNATDLKGDVVNMVAARPWGVACGDPNQHDMPWGSCMLPMECEAEYRIYRGDVFCGRTTFVCCALQLTTYDLYQGFDVSFEDSGLQTDSEERKHRGKKGSNEKRKKKSKKATQKRKRVRAERKRKIKRSIKRIIKEIRKILNRQFKNGTNERKRKTKQLKKFVAEMKKKYKQDRQSVKDVHEAELIKIDNALQTRLTHIRDMNDNFVKNATFRDIIVNGTVSKKGAKMLIEAYPELRSYFPSANERKADGGPVDYLEYDMEYGMLYY